MEIGLAEVPGANGLPPLWKPGIRQFYRSSLEAFRPAYAKAGLRGLQFGDEINTSPLSLLTARTYLDIGNHRISKQAIETAWRTLRCSIGLTLNLRPGRPPQAVCRH
jgi:hypothetical protein